LIFKPQYSTLDRSNPISAASPFIGFYTLFWLGLGLFTIRTFLVSYRITGRLFGHNIISILKKDVIILGLFDAFMFASTFLCVPLQKAVHRRWITWNGWGWILQHVTPTTMTADY
jgi:sterol O-acyltransferase